MSNDKDNGDNNKKETPAAPDRNFLEQLMKAAMNGDGSLVQRHIVEYSTKHELPMISPLKNFKDVNKRTALHFACQSKPLQDEPQDIVEMLLNKDKFALDALQEMVHTADVEGITPLMVVCQSMHSKTLERIKCILDIDPKTIAAKSKTDATVLHYAAGAGASREVITILYEHDKDALHACTKQGSTPLHWASSEPKDYTETIQTLLDLGAQVNVAGGIPPLIVALASKNDIHAKLLVANGADRGVLLGGNVTAYHMVADSNLRQTLQAMLDVDKDKDDSISAKCLQLKNDHDETPLDIAAKRGHLECFKLISGESDNTKAKEQMTILQNEWMKKIGESNNNNKDDNKSNNKDNNNSSNAVVMDEEAQAKTAAAMLLSNPPTISQDDKEKAAEFKQTGNSHFGKKEWTEAIEAYTQAIQLNPVDETYYSNRSAAYIQLAKNEEALHDAVICRYLKPKWVKGCYRLAVARMANGNYEDAAVSAWEGLSLDEGNSELEALVTKCIKKGRKEHNKANKK